MCQCQRLIANGTTICIKTNLEGNRRSFPSITYDVLDIVDSLIKILQMVLAECSVQGQCCSTALDFDGWFKEIETGQSIFFFLPYNRIKSSSAKHCEDRSGYVSHLPDAGKICSPAKRTMTE